MRTENYWIDKLNLSPHPEGGFYKEVFRSNEYISQSALPDRFNGDRAFSTSIFFLLSDDDFSAFHRIRQDEVWHFYDGSSLTIHIIDTNGRYFSKKLGLNPDENEIPQIVVPAGCFFAAGVNSKNGFTLTGCTVAPGFDFDDFEMPTRKDLVKNYPQHEKIITEFTKT